MKKTIALIFITIFFVLSGCSLFTKQDSVLVIKNMSDFDIINASFFFYLPMSSAFQAKPDYMISIPDLKPDEITEITIKGSFFERGSISGLIEFSVNTNNRRLRYYRPSIHEGTLNQSIFYNSSQIWTLNPNQDGWGFAVSGSLASWAN